MATVPLLIDVKVVDHASTQLKQIQSAIIRFVGAISASVAAVAGIAFPVTSAIQFERALADVRKTTGFTADEMERLSGSLRDMSKELSVPLVELTNIAAIGGQLGLGNLGREAIEQFTESVARASVALGLTQEQAAEAGATLRNVFNLAPSQIENLFSAVNELSNNSVANAQALIDITKRVGNTANLSADEVLALSAYMKELGVPEEQAGTALVKFFGDMLAEAKDFAEVMGVTTTAWTKTVERDAIGAFQAVVAKLYTLEAGVREFYTKQLFGSGRLFSAANKIIEDAASGNARLNELLGISNAAFLSGTSAIKEYKTVLQATSEQYELLKNTIGDIGIEIGNTFLPVVKQAIVDLREFFSNDEVIAFFVRIGEQFRNLVTSITDAIKWIKSLNINWLFLIEVLKAFVVFKALETFGGFAIRLAMVTAGVIRLTASWKLLTSTVAASVAGWLGLTSAVERFTKSAQTAAAVPFLVGLKDNFQKAFVSTLVFLNTTLPALVGSAYGKVALAFSAFFIKLAQVIYVGYLVLNVAFARLGAYISAGIASALSGQALSSALAAMSLAFRAGFLAIAATIYSAYTFALVPAFAKIKASIATALGSQALAPLFAALTRALQIGFLAISTVVYGGYVAISAAFARLSTAINASFLAPAIAVTQRAFTALAATITFGIATVVGAANSGKLAAALTSVVLVIRNWAIFLTSVIAGVLGSLPFAAIALVLGALYLAFGDQIDAYFNKVDAKTIEAERKLYARKKELERLNSEIEGSISSAEKKVDRLNKLKIPEEIGKFNFDTGFIDNAEKAEAQLVEVARAASEYTQVEESLGKVIESRNRQYAEQIAYLDELKRVKKNAETGTGLTGDKIRYVGRETEYLTIDKAGNAQYRTLKQINQAIEDNTKSMNEYTSSIEKANAILEKGKVAATGTAAVDQLKRNLSDVSKYYLAQIVQVAQQEQLIAKVTERVDGLKTKFAELSATRKDGQSEAEFLASLTNEKREEYKIIEDQIKQLEGVIKDTTVTVEGLKLSLTDLQKIGDRGITFINKLEFLKPEDLARINQAVNGVGQFVKVEADASNVLSENEKAMRGNTAAVARNVYFLERAKEATDDMIRAAGNWRDRIKGMYENAAKEVDSLRANVVKTSEEIDRMRAYKKIEIDFQVNRAKLEASLKPIEDYYDSLIAGINPYSGTKTEPVTEDRKKTLESLKQERVYQTQNAIATKQLAYEQEIATRKIADHVARMEELQRKYDELYTAGDYDAAFIKKDALKQELSDYQDFIKQLSTQTVAFKKRGLIPGTTDWGFYDEETFVVDSARMNQFKDVAAVVSAGIEKDLEKRYKTAFEAAKLSFTELTNQGAIFGNALAQAEGQLQQMGLSAASLKTIMRDVAAEFESVTGSANEVKAILGALEQARKDQALGGNAEDVTKQVQEAADQMEAYTKEPKTVSLELKAKVDATVLRDTENRIAEAAKVGVYKFVQTDLPVAGKSMAVTIGKSVYAGLVSAFVEAKKTVTEMFSGNTDIKPEDAKKKTEKGAQDASENITTAVDKATDTGAKKGMSSGLLGGLFSVAGTYFESLTGVTAKAVAAGTKKGIEEGQAQAKKPETAKPAEAAKPTAAAQPTRLQSIADQIGAEYRSIVERLKSQAQSEPIPFTVKMNVDGKLIERTADETEEQFRKRVEKEAGPLSLAKSITILTSDGKLANIEREIAGAADKIPPLKLKTVLEITEQDKARLKALYESVGATSPEEKAKKAEEEKKEVKPEESKPQEAPVTVTPTVPADAGQKVGEQITAQGPVATVTPAIPDVQAILNAGGPYSITVNANVVGLPKGAPSGTVEETPKVATGGFIRGPGTATSDSILAWLSNGEYVIDAFTTRFFGKDFFHTLKLYAKTGKLKLPGFNEGGIVGSYSQAMPAAAGTPINLTIDSKTFNLSASTAVAEEMRRVLSIENLKRGRR